MPGENTMSARFLIRLAAVALAATSGATIAAAYIHFPPMTLQKMCKVSTNIRLLSVKKVSKEKRVIVFESVENLKGKNPRISSFRQVLRADAHGVKPILDWASEGKLAVLFSIEDDTLACGYVFIDNYCYS